MLEQIVSIWVLNDTMDGRYDRATYNRWRKHLRMSSSKGSYIVMSTDFRPIIWGRRSSSTYSRLTAGCSCSPSSLPGASASSNRAKAAVSAGPRPGSDRGGCLARWQGRHGTQVKGDWRALGGQLGQYVPNQIQGSELCLLGEADRAGRAEPTHRISSRTR